MVRNGTTAATRLDELKGRLVALRFVSTFREITSRPEGPKGDEITKSYPVADVIAFSDDGTVAERLPDAVIMSSVLGGALVEIRGEWALGVVTESAQKGDKTRSFYSLTPVEAEVFSAAVASGNLE